MPMKKHGRKLFSKGRNIYMYMKKVVRKMSGKCIYYTDWHLLRMPITPYEKSPTSKSADIRAYSASRHQ